MEFWRYAAHTRHAFLASAECTLRQPLDKPSFREVASLADRGFAFLSHPVHVLVEDEALRCRAEGVFSHTVSRKELCRRVVRAADGVYVVSPEACLLQLADDLPFPNLVETGFEWCGGYARSTGEFCSIVQRDPLTTVAKLELFSKRVGGADGTKTLRKALRFVLDGSLSPMESVTVVLLCFPVRLGGYGLPLPVMNAVVEVPARERAFVKKSFYKCDLYWPEAKFAIEYDSNLHHTGATRIAEDASRRVDLAYLGVEVATLTQQQACDRREMDRIAHLLAKRLGKRLRLERFDRGAQDDLRSRLLGFS